VDVFARPELILLIVSARLLLPPVTSVVTQVISVAALMLMLRNTDPADRAALLHAAGNCLASLHRATPQTPRGTKRQKSR